MNCLIEIELMMSKKDDAKCQQLYEGLSTNNMYGEVFAIDITKYDVKSNASLIPAIEIMKLDGSNVEMIERKYQF